MSHVVPCRAASCIVHTSMESGKLTSWRIRRVVAFLWDGHEKLRSVDGLFCALHTETNLQFRSYNKSISL